jgi:Flp pilus assembly protein TadG
VSHGVIGNSWKVARAAVCTAGAKGRSLMRRMVARRGGGQSGQAMAEMAFVAPVILLVLTGICSFGIALNEYELLTYGTASGARAFALARSQASWSPTAASDICEYAYDIAAAAMPTLNTSNLTMSITFSPPTGADNSGGPWTNVTASSGCSSFSLDGTDINGVVSITTTYPVTPILWGRSMSLNLTATSAQQIQ